MIFSARLQRLEESATLRMAGLARELAQKGVNVINLSLGEPDFDTPDHIKTAAKAALDAGFTKYTPVAGISELREAIAAKMRTENGIACTAANVVVSNGAKQSIFNVAAALLNEGDEVLILSPYWVSYSEMIKLADATPVMLPSSVAANFKSTPDEIAAAITPRTRILLFSSPCNPTGSVYTRAELTAIAEVVAQHKDLYIVADEIYEYINFTEEGHFSIGSLPSVADRVVTVNGFSKGFAMTGWRLGYIVAPLWIAQACEKIQGQITSGATSFGQKAAVVALTADRSPTTAMREAYRRRRDIVFNGLSTIDGIQPNDPHGAFYIFPNIASFFGKQYGTHRITSSEDFCMFLLDVAHVATVAGSAFGDDDCFRISFAASDDSIREAIERIRTACALLK